MKNRRGPLEDRIMIAIGDEVVPTVKEVAERVGAFRQSTSRALRRLREKGLVEGNWKLTNAGKAELTVAEARETLRHHRANP